MKPAGRKDFSIASILAGKSVNVVGSYEDTEKFRKNMINNCSKSVSFTDREKDGTNHRRNSELTEDEERNRNGANGEENLRIIVSEEYVVKSRNMSESASESKCTLTVANAGENTSIIAKETGVINSNRNFGLITASKSIQSLEQNVEVSCTEESSVSCALESEVISCESSNIILCVEEKRKNSETKESNSTIRDLDDKGKILTESEVRKLKENEVDEFAGSQHKFSKQDQRRKRRENQTKSINKYENDVSSGNIVATSEEDQKIEELETQEKDLEEIQRRVTGSQVERLLDNSEVEMKRTEEKNTVLQTECLEKLAWLRYTRYKPPKIPRRLSVDKNKRRPSLHPRIPFSTFQLDFLEKKFQTSAYLTKTDVVEISTVLKLPANRVKIWFQNRRARERRETNKM